MQYRPISHLSDEINRYKENNQINHSKLKQDILDFVIKLQGALNEPTRIPNPDSRSLVNPTHLHVLSTPNYQRVSAKLEANQ